ncbi:1,4-alpha-glucan branching enzyme [Anaerobacillus alkalilacustris]|uniref:1,4-alpha-glucan branching enzyme GlgB n=1 Tax=Anaerobacillus alkalilacustris TaxID=393763 RepID=A0A1S2LJA9_9BACI|nr:1,4-alpha-glucan branching protein GlgB [Anaerobacillus alkalilacustris]OIJ12491.1 1,4-alpha-glucan branching enzyme [Anaerobacillus alkalilacustris]
MADIILSDHDLYLFHQGNLFYSYNFMGAHISTEKGEKGVRFTVWAPNAVEVRVVGSFNNWNGYEHKMEKITNNGIWTMFIPGLKEGDLYKYEILAKSGEVFQKSDPYAFYSELRPNTASKVTSLRGYQWNDDEWQQKKMERNVYEEPLLIYEVHLGSWKLNEEGEFLTYRELAHELVDYVSEMGYTHIEILPINEHPYDRSWGYQLTGYYSVTSRFGTLDDFKYFVDMCHQKGIGVILDWVPGHFCKDAHGLRLFDGGPVFEYEDIHKAEKKEWGTLTFDFGRPEVQSFLISNALFWMDLFHIDGLRVDAVSSMLYYNHGKSDDDVDVRNTYGGYENLEAISFIRKLNETVFHYYPNALMMAEESTAWPNVSGPTYLGGLGFNFKWNMGWMNDMLKYMEMDPIYRKFHHNLITFSFFYAYSENFLLPMSHDEVVHGKKSLLNKMPGDYWQKFANLRAFYGYMAAHPGKKLLFMGSEFGQFSEWKDLEDLDWEILGYEMHGKMHKFVNQLNKFYLNEPAFWELDHEHQGFQWIDPNNYEQSIVSFIRKGHKDNEQLIILCNFTPVVYHDYKVGVPFYADYVEEFNSDSMEFGGSGQKNEGIIKAIDENWHNQPYSIQVTIPPLSFVVFRPTNIQVKPKTKGGKQNGNENEKRVRRNVTSRGRREKTRTVNEKLS